MKKIISWKFASNLAIILTLIGGVYGAYSWFDKTFNKNNINATIEIKDYYLPTEFLSFSPDLIIASVNNDIGDILNNGERLLNKEINSSYSQFKILNKAKTINEVNFKADIWEKVINSFDIVEGSIKKKIKNRINNNKIKGFIVNNSDLAIINIQNNGENEVNEMQIDMVGDFFTKGYFEIIDNNKVIQSSTFKKIIELPKLRGNKSLDIRIWGNIYSKKQISITHPNGIVRPQEIINTTGFYAWTTKNLNSFFDFFFYIIAPMYFIAVIIFSYIKYQKSNQYAEDKVKKGKKKAD